MKIDILISDRRCVVILCPEVVVNFHFVIPGMGVANVEKLFLEILPGMNYSVLTFSKLQAISFTEHTKNST